MDILEKTVPHYVLLNNTELYVVKHVTARTRHVTMFMDAILSRVSKVNRFIHHCQKNSYVSDMYAATFVNWRNSLMNIMIHY